MKVFTALTTMAALVSASTVPSFRGNQPHGIQPRAGASVDFSDHHKAPAGTNGRKLQDSFRTRYNVGFYSVVDVPEDRHLAAQQDKESELRGATRPQRRLSFDDAAAPVDRHLAAEQRFQELNYVGILSRGAAQEEGPTRSLTDYLFVPVLPSPPKRTARTPKSSGAATDTHELPHGASVGVDSVILDGPSRRLAGQQQHAGQDLFTVGLDTLRDFLFVPVLPYSIGADEAKAEPTPSDDAGAVGIQQVGHESPSD
ncbi:hypothetical protein H257_09113 [Aphanomyces astaci]|uniref:RxLR effector protein n=1 Tax=Aphanomyces astaci TaxID=112090 RepID=W4GAD8_APHAT|nr:hypothetical protein H257_09113 [Aphanomyces astaci]ETV76620.1 hypothetical protein H257_09113 [Aphanomyces astaci]|eukprot:XP_009833532.1 hypothetical protein H257_09113 [Aphanomyces astaci]